MTFLYGVRQLTPQPPPAHRPLPAPYLVWLAAATVSQLGDVVLGFALGWVAAEHGGAAAGLVLAAGSVPSVLLLLLGGAIADRFGARRVMIAGDAVMLLMSVALALAVLHAGTPLWLLLAASVLRGVVSAFYRPSAGSMPRRLVADAQLTSALALRQGAGQTVMLLGAPLAGILVASGGLGAVAVLDAGTFLVVLVVLLLVRTRYATPASDRSVPVWRAALDGVRVVRRTPGLVAALTLVAGAAAFLLPTVSLVLPLLAREAGWSASATGVVAGAQGAGIILATVVVARRGGARRPGATASGGLAVAALGQAGLVAGATTPGGAGVAVAAAALVGVGSGLFTAHLAPVVLGSAPRTHLARVQALVGLVQVLAVTLTNAGLGALASATSPAVAGGVCALGLLGCAAGGAVALRRLTLEPVESAQ
ncbi:Major Facilitator Superfamily protein [Promicromonospora umidemergens]|uniref:MFS transporter n=1 Tax=Promicromonospora umidemergens TaxID=629679 RepID=A0ABP8WCU7_9MICO|nr:MFS transporter [Promicromonospora umidemergens]MCP2284345.1 Major Facilitator Superfamily protein [Promicromonospora umidemergens]